MLDSSPQGLSVVKIWDWKEGLFDITWSENNPNILVTGGGDGSLQVWDVTSHGQVRMFIVYIDDMNAPCYV